MTVSPDSATRGSAAVQRFCQGCGVMPTEVTHVCPPQGTATGPVLRPCDEDDCTTPKPHTHDWPTRLP